MVITFTVKPAAGSIYARMTERLGREPTEAEVKAEVKRIIAGVSKHEKLDS